MTIEDKLGPIFEKVLELLIQKIENDPQLIEKIVQMVINLITKHGGVNV